MTVHQLVIKNLSVLEQAPGIAEEVSDKVMGAVDAHVSEWASAQPGFRVEANFEKDWCYFWPENDWPIDPEEEEPRAYYQLGTTSEEDDDDYNYYISALTGAVSIKFGLRFDVNVKWFVQRSGQSKNATSRWQKFLADQVTQRPALSEAGFYLSNDGLFLPIQIEPEELANAFPHALADAFQPVDAALEKLRGVHPQVDAIVQAALKWSF